MPKLGSTVVPAARGSDWTEVQSRSAHDIDEERGEKFLAGKVSPNTTDGGPGIPVMVERSVV